MASRISILKSEAVGALPTASAMASGELAVNYADKKIYGKHPGSGAVVQVAASPIHTHALSDLSQSGATSGQVPTWNGTAWTPQTPSGSGSGSSVVSDTTGMTGASQLTNLVQITQAGYNAIATPNASTLYIISG
jgi:hypothetical protein